MAYTYGQMYKLFQDLLDKAGSPYVPKAQFDRIANMKYQDFVMEECAKIEINQEHKNRIHNLYKVFQKTNSSTILFPDDIADYQYIVRFFGVFPNPCGQGNIQSPIFPAVNNGIDVLRTDPFNKPTDVEPLYIPSVINDKKCYEVYSTTTPLRLDMTYVRNPTPIDSAGNPNTEFELPNECAEQVIRAVLVTFDVVIEQFPRAQFEGAMLNKLENQ